MVQPVCVPALFPVAFLSYKAGTKPQPAFVFFIDSFLNYVKCGVGIAGDFLPDKVYYLQYGIVLYQFTANAL